MKTYRTEVTETSRPVSVKEKINLKDTTSAIRLDQATLTDGRVMIDFDMWAILTVHNEASEDKEYNQYVILDKSGNKYVTGSNNFWQSFMEIYDEMKDEEENWGVVAYRVPSKKYQGKDFLTCAII